MSEIVAPIITDSTGQAIATAISGAVSKADKSDIAPEFSTSADYAKGSMVYYQGTLYEFTAAHNHVAWTGSDVIAVKVSSEINTLKSGLTRQYTITAYENVSFIHESISVNNKNVNMSLIAILNCTAGVWTNIGTISRKPNDNAITTCARSGDGTYLGMVEITPSGLIHMYPVQTISSGNDGVSFSIAYCTND